MIKNNIGISSVNNSRLNPKLKLLVKGIRSFTRTSCPAAYFSIELISLRWKLKISYQQIISANQLF